MAYPLLHRGSMRIVLRSVAAWLAAASLGACAAFTRFQIALRDFYFLEWRIHTALLLTVAIVAAAIAIRPSSFSRLRPTLVLVIGHLVAALGTTEFLSSRITCVNLTESIEYLIPTDTGALLLFGPTLTVLVASAAFDRLRRPQRHDLPPAVSNWIVTRSSDSSEHWR